MKTTSIYINCDSFFFIRNIMRQERGYAPLEDTEARRQTFKCQHPTGELQILNNSFDDFPIDRIKKLLTDSGFTYRNGEEVEYINI